MDATALKLVITFWHDDCPEDPSDCDGWSVYSFGNRHHNYKDPEDFDEERIRNLLKEGLAFPLDYFEHGQCLWSLAGELPPGANCPWDSVGHAGYIVWEQDADNLGPKSVEDRRADARAFVERYTLWCNGQVYGYTIEAYSKCPTCDQDEEVDEEEMEFDLPSVGGYYGNDFEGMIIDMKDNIGSDWADYDVEFKEREGYGLADEAERLWKEDA